MPVECMVDMLEALDDMQNYYSSVELGGGRIVHKG